MAFDNLTGMWLESNAMSNKFDKVAYQRDYMRKRRAKLKNPVQVAEPLDRASEVHAIPEGRTVGSNPATGATKDETLANLRGLIKAEEEKPVIEVPESTDTRSRSDIAMGIWRNDQGGVISKFAYDKLQKLKEHAKENNFEIDDYSQ